MAQTITGIFTPVHTISSSNLGGHKHTRTTPTGYKNYRSLNRYFKTMFLQQTILQSSTNQTQSPNHQNSDTHCRTWKTLPEKLPGHYNTISEYLLNRTKPSRLYTQTKIYCCYQLMNTLLIDYYKYIVGKCGFIRTFMY